MAGGHHAAGHRLRYLRLGADSAALHSSEGSVLSHV
jgi:hypothetical protein